MKVVDLSTEAIVAPSWNPNVMKPSIRARLRHSIERFDLVVPLVVRPTPNGLYETVGGAQRLAVLRELGFTTVPCFIVQADDTEARLLSEALNHIQGEDDLGLRAELLKEVLKAIPQQEVLGILPETTESLKAMTSLGQETMAQYLQKWQQAQAARLKHLQFQLTEAQLEVIEEALSKVLPVARQSDDRSPNVKGRALYLLCKAFLERNDDL